MCTPTPKYQCKRADTPSPKYINVWQVLPRIMTLLKIHRHTRPEVSPHYPPCAFLFF